MKNLEPSVRRERWLTRALCRRYAAVVFSTLSEPTLQNQPFKNRTICWAFGCLVKGEAEILGAWHLDEAAKTTHDVVLDLHNRGVEFLRCGLGDLRGVEVSFLNTFRMAALYPSIEQALAALRDTVRPFHRPAMSRSLRETIGDPTDTPSTVAALRFSSEELRQKYPGILEQWNETVAGFQPLFALPEPYRQLVRSVDRTAIGLQERLMGAIHQHGPFPDSGEAFDFVVDWLVRADLRLMRDAEAEELAREARALGSGRFAPVSGGAAGTPALA